MRARQPVGGQTLLARAIAAIGRNNGALFYVPANFAGAWTDSAGTDPVNEVADVIGRMTDRTGGSAVATQSTTASKPLVSRVPKRLGPNLVSNGNITGLPAGGGARFYNMTGAMTPLAAGKTYLMTYTVSGYSGTGNVGIAGAAPAGIVQTNNTANGSYRVVQTPTAGGVIVFYTTNTNTANFSAISVQEVLEWSYAMSFDGSNDFLQTGITTGNEGWVCAGVTPANTTTAMSVVNAGEGTSTIPGVWLFSTSSGNWKASAADGSLRTQQQMAMQGATPQVVGMGWNTSNLLVSVNNAEASTPKIGSGSWASGANVLRFGLYAGSSEPFNGHMHAIIYTPVLPSAADRAIIRKWIGSLQGQSL